MVGIAAAVLAGCGGIGSAAGASSSSAKTSPSPGRGNGNAAAGQLVNLASGKMTLAEQAANGGGTTNVTVSYDSSTAVLQTGTGSMTDVAPGVCVTANGEKDASGAVTATTLSVMLNMNGNCTQPAGGFGGPGGPSPGASPRAGARSPRPGASPGAPGGGLPANVAFVRGKVSAVSGTTVTVQQDTGGPATVNVPSTARVTRIVTSSTARLAVGECITANGQRDSSGTIKARNVVISAPGANGGCAFGGGGFGGGFGGGRGRPSASPSARTA